MDEQQLLMRIAELERRVEWLYRATGHGGSYVTSSEFDAARSSMSPAVLELLQQGNKIAAIKQYRAETGVGLAEAKAVVDQLG